MPIEVTDEVVEYIFQEIPPSDPCAVVYTYFNSWWQSSTCPGDLESAMMTRANRHLCMERHRLARLQYSTPFKIADNTVTPVPEYLLPQSIANYLCLQPAQSIPSCTSCCENFVLATECLDELAKVYRNANPLYKSPPPDVDTAWSNWTTNHPSPDHATPDPSPASPTEQVNLTAISSNANSAWERYLSSDPSIITPDPDAAWDAFNTTDTQESRRAILSPIPTITAPDPDAAWENFLSLPDSDAAPDVQLAPDADSAWDAFNALPENTEVIPAPVYDEPVVLGKPIFTTRTPLRIPDETIIPTEAPNMWTPQPRLRPVPKKKHTPQDDSTNAVEPDLDALWASLGGEGETPQLPNAVPSSVKNFSIPPPAHHYEPWWHPSKKAQAPSVETIPPPSPRGSASSIINADDVDMEFLNADAESVSTIDTPIRRITLPSPTLSAQAMADVNFFDTAVDDEIFADETSFDMEDGSVEYF